MGNPDNNSTFHTDQNRWDRRDFEKEQFSKEDEFQGAIDDNEYRASLEGHRAEEFDEGEALSYHEDRYPDGMSRIQTDDNLERVIKELLHNSARIDARDITLVVDNTNVTLSGTVRTQEDRDYATEIVKLVHGVGDVHSEIIVKRNQGILPTDVGRNPN